MEWWTGLSLRFQKLAKGLVAMTATCAFIVAVGPAWLALGLPILSTQTYVHEHVKEEVSKVDKKLDEAQKLTRSIASRQVETQASTVEIQRSLLEKEMFELEIALKTKEVPDQVRSMLELRRRALDDDRKLLDYKADQLLRSNSGRRP